MQKNKADFFVKTFYLRNVWNKKIFDQTNDNWNQLSGKICMKIKEKLRNSENMKKKKEILTVIFFSVVNFLFFFLIKHNLIWSQLLKQTKINIFMWVFFFFLSFIFVNK